MDYKMMSDSKLSRSRICEILIVIGIIGILAFHLFGSSWVSGTRQYANTGIGYLDERTAIIKVERKYEVGSMYSATTYRVDAQVLAGQDDPSIGGESATFNINPSIIKGQFNHTDIFRELKVGDTYTIKFFGAKSDRLGEFPNIKEIRRVEQAY